ncbi:NUDIX domain-containing protein [Psychrobacillus sp. Sa2BUA9]|uniref:NUDIX domain-containing protein n=1 Tax=Psychrobacillus faecigallinarum TaxID=2762235 RepID=A0ABR8RDX2_9BACI|nr:NUDIX domain-containing protein [Psychrobacillus faecigallinarum]MBD7945890.1 NUDIX domain-containing protein [Psychrobacillus faecigallinarum]
MDLSFKTDEGRFNYRVAGLLLNESKVLIMKDENSPYYYFPGGRVSMHEKSEDAILREIREELSVDAAIERLLWINENFFEEEVLKEKFHEICFIYLLSLKDDKLLIKGNEFEENEEGKIHTYYWKTFDELKELNVYPLFLKNRCSELPEHLTHFVETK